MLVRAAPGTGKTWSVQQLVYFLAKALGDGARTKDGVELVPFVMYIQDLARMLRGEIGMRLEIWRYATLSSGQAALRWRQLTRGARASAVLSR